MEVITIFGNSGRGPTIGEDTVDLLVLVEKTFDIQFTEDDLIPGTVGKLCDFVISRLPGERSSKCMSSVCVLRSPPADHPGDQLSTRGNHSVDAA
jgi:hypothetical protein